MEESELQKDYPQIAQISADFPNRNRSKEFPDISWIDSV